MSKDRPSKQFAAFERTLDDLLAVPKSVLDERMREHREKAALNPKKRGPKTKVKQPSGASRDAS